MSRRKYTIPLADLIDALTIDQIKEVLSPEVRRQGLEDEMRSQREDIDAIALERELRATGRVLRLVILLAQANLHVWRSKDLLIRPEEYLARLEFAQELNSIRNHVRNLLGAHFGEAEACHRRAVFLDHTRPHWYTSLLFELEPSQETSGA